MSESHFPIRDIGLDPRPAQARVEKGADGADDGVSFQDVLRDSIKNVDKLQNDAESAIKSMVTGESESVAEVMTAVEKADIAFRTLMDVRNKLVDAYQEIMRMRF